MPSGYTAGVQDGSIKTLEDFALSCARNFGACVTMREEPTGTEIPQEFKPNTKYHDEGLKEAKEEYQKMLNMSLPDVISAKKGEYEKDILSYKETCNKREKHRGRYISMLNKVTNWKYPDTHHNLRQFMIKQIEDSLEWDCGHEIDKPEELCADDWHRKQIKKVIWSIDYHSKAIVEEVDRVTSRNKWIKGLRKSL